MSKRTTLILALLLFGILAFAIVGGAPTGALSPVPSRFLEFQRSEVKTLDLKSAKGDIHLERDAADPERWRVLAGRTLVRAESAKVEDLLNDLERLKPRNFWLAREVKPGERTTFGLDAPSLTVKLGLPAGPLRADFGKRTAESLNVYAGRDAGGDVFVVPAEPVGNMEELEAVALRERRPVGISTYDLASFLLERADGLRFEAARPSGGGGTWEAQFPWRGAVEPTAMEAFLAPILDVEVADFLADGSPDLDRYGLLKPAATITLRRRGREKPVVLRLGSDRSFMEEGEPSVYASKRDLGELVAKFDPAPLRDRNALRLGWAHLDAVEYAAGDEAWKILRVLDRWDMEKPERMPAEETAVEGLLEALRNLEVVRFLDGKTAAELGLDDPLRVAARLVITGGDEAGNRTLHIGPRDEEGNAPARLLSRPDAREAEAFFVLPSAFLDRMDAGWTSLRSTLVWKVDQDLLRSLTRTWEGRTLTFKYADRGWKADDGGPRPDAAALDRLLAHILEIHATGWAGRVRDAPGSFGVGKQPAGPVFVLRFEEGGRTTERVLALGAEVEGGGAHYARVDGGDLVFRLPNQLANGPDLSPLWEILTADLVEK